MKIRRTFLLLMVLLTIGVLSELRAQVTVGFGEPPIKAAILDVKTQKPDGENLTSTMGGIVFPRVKLVDVNTLKPFLKGADLTDNTLKKIHIGLTVYNLNETSPFELGLYVWDGQKWMKKGNTVSSLSVDNGLTLDGNDVKLGGTLKLPTTIDQKNNHLSFLTGSTGQWQINDNDFIVKGNGNVGIGTNVPAVKLDVKGKVNSDGYINVSGNTALKANTSVDGQLAYNRNAGVNKYLMATDDTGAAEWVDIKTDNDVIVVGIASEGANVAIPYNTAPYYSSNQNITLLPGRWLIKMTFLMTGSGRVSTNSEKLWIKLGLACRTTGNGHKPYDAYRDKENPASPVYIETVLDRKFNYTAITGDIVIDTDTGGTFDLVVIKDQLRPDNNASFNWDSKVDLQLNRSATENVLLAIPLN